MTAENSGRRLDALREIAHIGAGNASNSLSQMTGMDIDVTFPEIAWRAITEVPDALGDRAEPVTVVSMDIRAGTGAGEVSLGRLLLLFDIPSAQKLAALLVGDDTDGEPLNPMQESALKETGNILAGNCLSAITEMVDLELRESVPHLKTDMLGSIMDNFLLEIAKEQDDVLVFRTEFRWEEHADAYFIFLFNPAGHKLILDRLSDDLAL